MQRGPHRKGVRRVAGRATHEEDNPSGLIRFSGTERISGNIKNRQNPIFPPTERKKEIGGRENTKKEPYENVRTRGIDVSHAVQCLYR